MENSKENVHVDIGACNAYTYYRGDHHYHKLPKSKALGRRKKMQEMERDWSILQK